MANQKGLAARAPLPAKISKPFAFTRRKIVEFDPTTLQQTQTEMKTSERISSMESRFEQPRELSRHHRLLLITVLRSGLFGWGIVRLLRRWCLVGHWATDQAIKLNYKPIKPSQTATRPLYETNVSQTTSTNTSLSRLCTTPIQQNHHGNLTINYPLL